MKRRETMNFKYDVFDEHMHYHYEWKRLRGKSPSSNLSANR